MTLSFIPQVFKAKMLYNKLLYLFCSFVFGIGFVLFTFIVRADKFTKFDFDTSVKLQDRFSQISTDFLSQFSFLASVEVMLLALVILTILRRKILGVFALVFFVIGHVVEIYGKVLLDHPSPPMMFLKNQDTTFFPGWYSHPVSSYPSGHSFRATIISILIFIFLLNSKKLNRYIKLSLLLAIAFFVISIDLSRILLGTHWPSDVVGGFLLGGNLAFLSLVFL